MKSMQPTSTCTKCVRLSHFGKYACQTCQHMYTSNFQYDTKQSAEYQEKQEAKQRLEDSDPRLRTIYHRIKEKYFGGEYLPDPDKVVFEWMRSNVWRKLGTCRKTSKIIRINQRYLFAFNDAPADDKVVARLAVRKEFIKVMIHEALHLRMAHHRKNFKIKCEALESMVVDDQVDSLFAELDQLRSEVQ